MLSLMFSIVDVVVVVVVIAVVHIVQVVCLIFKLVLALLTIIDVVVGAVVLVVVVIEIFRHSLIFDVFDNVVDFIWPWLWRSVNSGRFQFLRSTVQIQSAARFFGINWVSIPVHCCLEMTKITKTAMAH